MKYLVTTREKANNVTYGAKVHSFRLSGSDFTNYLTDMEVQSLMVALSYMEPADAIDVSVKEKSLQDMGQFKTKTIDHILAS